MPFLGELRKLIFSAAAFVRTRGANFYHLRRTTTERNGLFFILDSEEILYENEMSLEAI